MSSNPTSKLLTFQSLISDCKYEVVMPIIQRDYAQGREGKEELRENFLNSLHSAVMTGEKLELDFVYGDVRKGIFKPLDGQQRLTTLFLLHWYAATKNPSVTNTENILSKFTYETRTSSREFCNDLVTKGIVYDESKIISKLIVDSSWFFLSWKRDPTIQSMLTMLDAIQEKFKNEDESLWTKLNNISFHFIELQNFGLSDDLYIKMNARGKPLTEFENFKAKFEQFIEQNKWEDGVDINDTFAHKIDTSWTDLFWKHRKENGKIDDNILKFFVNVAITNYAKDLIIYENQEESILIKKDLQQKTKGKTVTDEAVKRERIEQRIAKLFNNPQALKPEDFYTRDLFFKLKEDLELYSDVENLYDKIYPSVKLWNGTTENNSLFIDIVQLEKVTTYKQRVLFYAQTRFLIAQNQQSLDFDQFSNWMRVVRNIVENSTIDSATTFIGAINLISELSAGSQSIYTFFQNTKIESKFAEKQVNEEVSKASLHDTLHEEIIELEDTDFCRGTINWCLECADKNSVVESSLLKSIKKIIDLYLSENNISNLFRRALLTIGDNRFYNYWESWSYNTDSIKRCFIEDRNDLRNCFTNGWWFKTYLKPLMNQLFYSSLEDIVENYIPNSNMPNWKVRIIKESNLLEDYAQSHYLGITQDDTTCYLFGWKKRPANREECMLIE